MARADERVFRHEVRPDAVSEPSQARVELGTALRGRVLRSLSGLFVHRGGQGPHSRIEPARALGGPNPGVRPGAEG